MKKLFLLIPLFLSFSIPAVSQWVFDYQINPQGYTSIRDLSMVDTNYIWLTTIDSQYSGNIYKKIGSSLYLLNSGGIFRPAAVSAIDSSSAYMSPSFDKRIYYTSNSGQNWQIKLDTIGTVFYTRYKLLRSNPLCIVAIRLSIADSTISTFYKSTNGGINWQTQLLDFSSDLEVYDVQFTDLQHMWLGTNCQNNCNDLRFYYTTNSGLNWLIKTFSTISNNHVLNAPIFKYDNQTGITFSPGYNTYIYKTTDGGINWSNAQIFISGPTVFVSGLKNVDSTQIWICATDRRIFQTTNDGENWIEMTIPLTDSDVVNCIDLKKSGNMVYSWVGTSKGRIFKLVEDVNSIGIKSISNEVPKFFSLYQNYPNPFNPVTKIRFAIGSNVKGETACPDCSGSNVKVTIYDVLGREIGTLVNQALKPGSYEIDWDASNLPSGLYIYKLEAGNYIEAKKMLLIK